MGQFGLGTDLMRRSVWGIATLALVAGSFTAGRVGGGRRAVPEIVATLPGDESGFSRGLDDRIRTRFPVGSSEDALVDYLVGEKFSPEWRRRDGANSSVFVADGLICTKTIHVLWRADAAGTLTDVHADYHSQCL